MADIHGRFLWYEYLANDLDKAQAFYKKVVGWGSERFPNPNQRYELWTRKDGTSAGGLMALPEEAREAGVTPHWLSYVGTPRLDQTLAKASGLGSKTLMGPTDIPTVGRIVILQDPQGASFALYQPTQAASAETPPEPGQFSWHELATPDPEAAWKFYSALFGWVKTSAMDMGELGSYQMFGRRADTPLGGIYRKPKEMVGPPAWLPYAMVPEIQAAAKRIKGAGGTVANGPMEVPGGDWIVMALDPQGGLFALHAYARKPVNKAAKAAKKPVLRKKPVRKAAKKKPARKTAKKTAKKKATRRHR